MLMVLLFQCGTLRPAGLQLLFIKSPVQTLLPFHFQLIDAFLFLFCLLTQKGQFPNFLFPYLFQYFIELLTYGFFTLDGTQMEGIQLGVFPVTETLKGTGRLFFQQFILAVDVVKACSQHGQLLFQHLLVKHSFGLRIHPFPYMMNILRFVPFFSLPCCFQIFVLHFDHSQQSVTLTLKFPGKFFQLAFLLCHFFQQLFFLFLQRREYFPRCPKSVIQFSGQCTGLLLQIMHFPIKFNHPVGLPADSYLTVLIFPEPLTDVGHFFIEPAQMMGILPQIDTHIFFVQRHDNGLLDKLCIKF